MIYADIDEMTPCLKDSFTGEIVETEAFRIKRKSVLAKFTKENGWYANWVELSKTSEIYALAISGTYSFQGLLAVRDDPNSKTAFMDWAVASPENNPMIALQKKYLGVGGHLFAIAVKKSLEYGYGGALSGYAANADLLKHYIKAFNAIHIGQLHPYQIFIDEKNAQSIKEVYTYEWSDELA